VLSESGTKKVDAQRLFVGLDVSALAIVQRIVLADRLDQLERFVERRLVRLVTVGANPWLNVLFNKVRIVRVGVLQQRAIHGLQCKVVCRRARLVPKMRKPKKQQKTQTKRRQNQQRKSFSINQINKNNSFR
jgi:hypothetical protein